MEKPKVITNLEIEEGVFSVITLKNDILKLRDKISQKKYKNIYSVGTFSEKKVEYDEVIYETPQPFFLHLKKTQTEWYLNIYYKPENYKELIFFINQLDKN